MSKKKKQRKDESSQETEFMEPLNVADLRRLLAEIPSFYDVLLNVRIDKEWNVKPLSKHMLISDKNEQIMLTSMIDIEEEDEFDQNEETIYGES